MNLENVIKTSISFIEFKGFVETVNESADSFINKLATFVFKNAHLINDQLLNLLKEKKFKDLTSLSAADLKTINSIETTFKVVFVVAFTWLAVKISQIIVPLILITKSGYDFYKNLDKAESKNIEFINLTSLEEFPEKIQSSPTTSEETTLKPSNSTDSKEIIEIVDEPTTDDQLEQEWGKLESDRQSVEIEAEASDKLEQEKMDYVWPSPLPVEHSLLDTNEPELEEIFSKNTPKSLAVTVEIKAADRRIAALAAHLIPKNSHNRLIPKTNHSRM